MPHEQLSALAEQARQIPIGDGSKLDFVKFRAEMLIKQLAPDDRHYIDNLKKLRFFPNSFPCSPEAEAKRWNRGCAGIASLLETLADQLESFGSDAPALKSSQPIELICNRFHIVARQLSKRHSSRPTLEIRDEYDVQDLMHALLCLHFDDIRAEEYTPSYAGKASRVDFLIKDESIVLEIKKTRSGMGADELGSQLIDDSRRYRAHPDCKLLICFVYDPEGHISNPRGLENDLSMEMDSLPVQVIIRPK